MWVIIGWCIYIPSTDIIGQIHYNHNNDDEAKMHRKSMNVVEKFCEILIVPEYFASNHFMDSVKAQAEC